MPRPLRVIASGRSTTFDTLIRAVIKACGSDLQPEFRENAARMKSAAAARNRYAVDKAARVLGWAPQITLEEGLRRLVAWQDAQRNAQHHLQRLLFVVAGGQEGLQGGARSAFQQQLRPLHVGHPLHRHRHRREHHHLPGGIQARGVGGGCLEEFLRHLLRARLARLGRQADEFEFAIGKPVGLVRGFDHQPPALLVHATVRDGRGVAQRLFTELRPYALAIDPAPFVNGGSFAIARGTDYVRER